jgi:hypothetical protein
MITSEVFGDFELNAKSLHDVLLVVGVQRWSMDSILDKVFYNYQWTKV